MSSDTLVINLPLDSLVDNASQNLSRLSKDSGIKIDVNRSKTTMSIFVKTEKKASYEQLNEVDLDLFKYQVYQKACKHVTKKIDIEKSEVAKIIGKNGSRINQLQEMFGVRLKIDRDNQMSLTGHDQSIDDCLKEINHSQASKFILDDNEMILYLMELKVPHLKNMPKDIKSIYLGPTLHFAAALFGNARKSSSDHSILFNDIVEVDLKAILKKGQTELNLSSIQIPGLDLPSAIFENVQEKVFKEHNAYLKKNGHVFATKENLLIAMNYLLSVKDGYHSFTFEVPFASYLKGFFNIPNWKSKFDLIEVGFEEDKIIFYGKNPSIKQIQIQVECLGEFHPSNLARKYKSKKGSLLNHSVYIDAAGNISSTEQPTEIVCKFDDNEMYVVGVSSLKKHANLDSVIKKLVIELNEIEKKSKDTAKVITTIPQKYHKQLIGPNGKALNDLIEKYATDQSSCIVRFGSNSRPQNSNKSTPLEVDQVLFIGHKNVVAAVKNEMERLVEQWKHEHVMMSYQSQVEISQKALPRVVGKKFANIQKFKDLPGISNIDVPPKTDSDKITISLQGKKEVVLQVIKELKQNAEDVENSVSHFIPVEKEYLSAVIGQKGKIINQLQELYQVKLNVNEADDCGLDIIGGKESVARCKKDIEYLLRFEKDHNTECSIKVPQDSVSYIIGRNGTRVEKLKYLTGCNIQIPKEKTEIVEIIIKGKLHKLAKDSIEYILDYFKCDKNRLSVLVPAMAVNFSAVSRILTKYDHFECKDKEAMLIASIVTEKPYTQLSSVNFSIKNNEIVVYGYNTKAMNHFVEALNVEYANTKMYIAQLISVHRDLLNNLENEYNVKINFGKKAHVIGDATPEDFEEIVIDKNGDRYVCILGSKDDALRALEKIKEVRNKVEEVPVPKSISAILNRESKNFKVMVFIKHQGETELWKIEGQEDELKTYVEHLYKRIDELVIPYNLEA
eukprot:NODE_5_length_72347_cov_1.339331.p2 type:complete len:958 gc:universal NODE_5_length_72347_cov_1.339331:30525-33398(+)